MEKINVIYTGNSYIFKGIFLSALSVLKHTKRSLHFYIMTMSLPEDKDRGLPINEEQINILKKYIKDEDEITLIDVTSSYNKSIKNSKNRRSYYTPYCVIRLYINEYIKDIDKAIYLDADTMLLQSLELFEKEVDISNYEIGAAMDYLGRFWVRKDYFNSGVLYINLIKTKETKVFERAVELLCRKKYFMADQSALNNLIKSRYVLPRRFNEQRPIKEDTIIAHYTKHVYRYWDPLKPWDIERMHKKNIHAFDDLYEIYKKEFNL